MDQVHQSQNTVHPDYHESDPENMRVDQAFDNDCSWPRRLLRISTLKSYPWRPGNTYDGQREPRYFAITYTWGRWQLADDSHPSLKNLDFGTPWPIPRVDPDRFTPDHFVNFIQSLPVRPPPSNRLRSYGVDVDFLWLDVACIDQRNGSREKDLEIGRQATIFRGAHQVFAWLHQFTNNEVHKYYQEFREGYGILLSCLEEMKGYTSEEQKLVLKELSTLKSRIRQQGIRLIAGKAWTKVGSRLKKSSKLPSNPELDVLEEKVQRLVKLAETSGLSPRGKNPPKYGPVQKVRGLISDIKKLSIVVEDLKSGIHLMIGAMEKFSWEPWFSSLWTLQEGFLRQDAFLKDRDGKPWVDISSQSRLSDFIDLLYELSKTLASSIIVHTFAAEELRAQVEKLGCLEMKSRIPTILLKASHSRTVNPAYANDRVYGVMQIFGFKLGRSAPDCPPNIEYSLDDLEDQLGSALLYQSPIMSQMFFHTEPAPAGKGWRMSAHVDIPPLGPILDAYLNSPSSTIEANAELSVTKSQSGLVGHFSGMTCNLETLHQIFERSYYARDISISFDTVDFSDGSQLAEEIEVLMLGISRLDARAVKLTKVICLLLSRSEENSRFTEWRRRGLCFWSLEESFLKNLKLNIEESDLIHGRGSHWIHRSGTFG